MVNRNNSFARTTTELKRQNEHKTVMPIDMIKTTSISQVYVEPNRYRLTTFVYYFLDISNYDFFTSICSSVDGCIVYMKIQLPCTENSGSDNLSHMA